MKIKRQDRNGKNPGTQESRQNQSGSTMVELSKLLSDQQKAPMYYSMDFIRSHFLQNPYFRLFHKFWSRFEPWSQKFSNAEKWQRTQSFFGLLTALKKVYSAFFLNLTEIWEVFAHWFEIYGQQGRRIKYWHYMIFFKAPATYSM